MKDNILLVEGVNDKAFFERLCNKHRLNYKVRVCTPVDVVAAGEGGFNSKQGVINSLKTLLPLLEDEDSSYNKIGLILDADITGENNGGFQETISQIEVKASEYNYVAHSYSNPGIELKHSDAGMHSIGIWGNDSNLLIVFYVQIMPDDFVMQLHRF
ncbi:DUF3226 domain-containing protein [Pseudocitrobacter faecalis]|uniref:DUF3226 domain-containing protein n=1 Tax=Pseudocitrobacter faecalis TaxID=1398493 RepID=UPI004062AD51